MANDGANYQKLLSELIQKHMVMLGPNIALDKARKVAGLSVGETGEVVELSGDPRLVLKSLINEYATLSSHITQLAVSALFKKYPGVAQV